MSAKAASAGEPDSGLPEEDSLSGLEERILRAVDLVASLRAERDAAVAELDSARQAASTAMAEAQKTRAELERLRGERKQVRVRIEKLLGQMDLLSGQ
jgi:FtsZ-binding cell division protein ZapB